MFDRRTASRREWSVLWRYAVTLLAIELVAVLLSAAVNSSPAFVSAALLYALVHALAQLVILGIATAVLVRYHVQTFHVWAGAAAVNLPLLVAAVLPYDYWFSCYLASAALAVAWTIVVARISFRVADPRIGHLCGTCFYDLRGLNSRVCPECGTPITSPAAASPPPPPCASP